MVDRCRFCPDPATWIIHRQGFAPYLACDKHKERETAYGRAQYGPLYVHPAVLADRSSRWQRFLKLFALDGDAPEARFARWFIGFGLGLLVVLGVVGRL